MKKFIFRVVKVDVSLDVIITATCSRSALIQFKKFYPDFKVLWISEKQTSASGSSMITRIA